MAASFLSLKTILHFEKIYAACTRYVKKNDLLVGKINAPSSGKKNSLLLDPATPSSPSRTLEGLFELTQRPSRALDSPRALLPEL